MLYIGINWSLKFTLIDGDVISIIETRVCDFHFDGSHTHLMRDADIVIDTIDFLDLEAILLLHETAEKYSKPLLSGMTIGWGSCGIFFPNAGEQKQQFRKIFEIGVADSESPSYVLKFAQLFEKIKDALDPQVVSLMHDTFIRLANNQTCSAPQVVGGCYNLASLISSLLFKYVNGEKVPESPYLVISDVNKTITHSLFDLG